MVLIRTRRRSRLEQILIYPSKELTRYLNLFALAHNTTRMSIIRDVLESWHRTVLEELPEEMLIEKVITSVEKQWELSRRADKTRNKPRFKDFDEFLDQLENELNNKKPRINTVTIKTIIQILDEKNQAGRYPA